MLLCQLQTTDTAAQIDELYNNNNNALLLTANQIYYQTKW